METSIAAATSLDTPEGIAAQLERRRRAVAEAWNLGDEVVLLGAGDPVSVPGRGDRMYPFRAHSEYLYLTDRERPRGVLAFDPHEGWVDFVTPVTRDERLWEGAHGDAQEGRPASEFDDWLAERHNRPLACLGARVPGVAADETLESELRYALNHVRRPKDEIELARMRVAERATSAGFAAVQPLLVPGNSERQVQIELEAEFFRNGADFLAFDTIVGGGPNSAIIHVAPSPRPFGNGELILIDAGGEYRGYASDITRTYPASGEFTPEQAELYGLVRRAGLAARAGCIAGTEWRYVHRTAALVIAEGLVEFGLLRGDPESLVERGAQSVFFPHGIGHMVGLGVRDAGDTLKGRRRGDDEFPRLRMDRPLLPRYVVTVEPGIYLVPALLHDPEFRDRYRDAVDWERAEQLLDFGGIRIEDNVLITDEGPEVLTADVPVLA
ncbi:MAG: aminopeptidase P family protein [Actinomycetota bacterium]|nr:aminopeptidase P family protein [Actinomycetota bacterium]